MAYLRGVGDGLCAFYTMDAVNRPRIASFAA